MPHLALRLVSHPNVISLVDAFEDLRAFQLVVEFCGGGELFDKVLDVGELTESQAAMLMKQICSPLAFMKPGPKNVSTLGRVKSHGSNMLKNNIIGPTIGP